MKERKETPKGGETIMNTIIIIAEIVQSVALIVLAVSLSMIRTPK